jgi:hypothetical protein
MYGNFYLKLSGSLAGRYKEKDIRACVFTHAQ